MAKGSFGGPVRKRSTFGVGLGRLWGVDYTCSLDGRMARWSVRSACDIIIVVLFVD